MTNAKKAYFHNKFQENKHNPRELWNQMKCLSNDNAGQNHGIQRLIVDDGNTTDKMTIAETLNCFFTDRQSHLISTKGSPADQKIDLDPSLLHENATLNIPHVSKTRISELLLSIPTHKATGDDGISVLPMLSKLLEKHICKHLYDFCQERGLLHRLQSGFRKFHTTEIALIRLIDQLLFDFDRNKVSELIFVNYKKAFVLIDHLLLMKKLDAYGIRGNELNLLRDYLSNRSQYVNVDGYCSSLKPVEFHVP